MDVRAKPSEASDVAEAPTSGAASADPTRDRRLDDLERQLAAVTTQVQEQRDEQRSLATVHDLSNRTLDFANTVIQTSALLLALGAVFAAVVSGFGLWSARKSRAEKRAAMKEINQFKAKAAASAKHVEGIRTSLVKAFSDVKKLFAELDEAEQEPWMGDEPPSPDKLDVELEDRDVLLTVADRLGLIDDPPSAAPGFVSLGRYWLGRQDYDRAYARATRARALADSVMACCTQARAIAFRQGVSPSQLESALEIANQAEEFAVTGTPREKMHALEAKAYVLQCLERFDDAIEVWKAAREADARANEGKESHYSTYNLMCCYALKRDLSSAMDLFRIHAREKNWAKNAKGDSDLASLREDPSFAAEFAALVQQYDV